MFFVLRRKNEAIKVTYALTTVIGDMLENGVTGYIRKIFFSFLIKDYVETEMLYLKPAYCVNKIEDDE